MRLPAQIVASLFSKMRAPPGRPLTVAVDDSVFRRSGRKVHGADWQYDGPAPALPITPATLLA